MNMIMKVVIGANHIGITGISTHNKAQAILQDLRDFIETRNRNISIGFEGSPGPFGDGICLKIRIYGKPLDELTIKTLKKFFELRGAIVLVEE
ncbi:MAG: hypothetical protein DRO40_10780 [Thermoprotei archaeon]|nr:MAG: hypothetical protein DRO40_10780 [Thermoprotei archaeon]